MKTPAWRPLFVLSLFCLISACAVREGKTSIYADYDPGTSFTDYRTFAWMTQNPLVASTPDVVNPNLQTNLMAETAAQLKNKGLSARSGRPTANPVRYARSRRALFRSKYSTRRPPDASGRVMRPRG
jgi:hypothetical protein